MSSDRLHPLHRIPLRISLVIALVLTSAIGLAVTGVVVTSQLGGYLVDQVDKDLIQSAQRLDQPGDRGGRDRGGPFASNRDEYFGFSATDGTGLVGDVNHAGVHVPALTQRQVLAAGARPFTVPATGGGPSWRVVVRSGAVRTTTGEPVLVVRGVSLADVEDTIHRLALVELAVGGLMLLLLGGLAYAGVRTSLRPLVQVEATAARIAAGDLTQRVPESSPRTEVGRLSQAFNTMLGQIETAFREREASEHSALASEDRMRRFVADASHELRTPLTSIRGFAELYRQGAVPDKESLDRVMRRVEDEAARMGLLVEDLLLLARLDQQRPLEQKPVDLFRVAGDAVDDARVLAPDRSIELTLIGNAGHGAAPIVLGDEGRLRQVVTNLVSNALTHTPAGSPVAVSLEVAEADAQVLIVVTDHGPGMSEADRAKVFERFYRADPSRTRAAGGSGLGLSIVAALVAAHGGRVGVQSVLGEGSRFLVELPRYVASAPSGLLHVIGGSQPDHRLTEQDHDRSPDVRPVEPDPAY